MNEKSFQVSIEAKGMLPAKLAEEAESILKENDRVSATLVSGRMIVNSIWDLDAEVAIDMLRTRLGVEIAHSKPAIVYKEDNDKILEPVMESKVTFAVDYAGEVMGVLVRRRGLLVGFRDDEDGRKSVACDVPLSELIGYSSDLRAMTNSTGKVEVRFKEYQVLPDPGGPDPDEPASMALRA